MSKKLDEVWWYGACNARLGTFPAQYVEDTSVQAAPLRPARALFDFRGSAERNELSFSSGDALFLVPTMQAPEGWTRVMRGNEEGFAPLAYIREEGAAEEPRPVAAAEAAPAPAPAHAAAAAAAADAPVAVPAAYDAQRDGEGDLSAAGPLVALYNFQARSDQELSLVVGEELLGLSRLNADWWQARSVLTGTSGRSVSRCVP